VQTVWLRRREIRTPKHGILQAVDQKNSFPNPRSSSLMRAAWVQSCNQIILMKPQDTLPCSVRFSLSSSEGERAG